MSHSSSKDLYGSLLLKLTVSVIRLAINGNLSAFLQVSTVAFRTLPSSPFLASNARPNGQLFLLVCWSFNMTLSPATRLRRFRFHCVLTCRLCNYSPLHLDHNWSSRCCTLLNFRRPCRSWDTNFNGRGPCRQVLCVSNMEGVSGRGSSESEGMVVMGWALAIA